MAHPVLEFLFVRPIQCNPVWHSLVQLPSLDQPTLDPIVNYARADSKVLGHLLHGQLLRPPELRRRNLIASTDPPHNLCGVRLTFGTGVPFLIEPIRDLGIE